MNPAYNKQSIDVIIGTDVQEEPTNLNKSHRGARKKSRQMEQWLELIWNLTDAYRLARLFEFRLVPLPGKRYRFTFVINVMKMFRPVQLHEKDMILKKIVRHKNPTDEIQAYSLTSTSNITPRPAPLLVVTMGTCRQVVFYLVCWPCKRVLTRKT